MQALCIANSCCCTCSIIVFWKFSIRVVGIGTKGKLKTPRCSIQVWSDSLSIHDMSGFQFVIQTLGESEKLVAACHVRCVTHLYDIHVSCLLMEYQASNAGLMLSVYK
jgi:hypothetical protein